MYSVLSVATLKRVGVYLAPCNVRLYPLNIAVF